MRKHLGCDLDIAAQVEGRYGSPLLKGEFPPEVFNCQKGFLNQELSSSAHENTAVGGQTLAREVGAVIRRKKQRGGRHLLDGAPACERDPS